MFLDGDVIFRFWYCQRCRHLWGWQNSRGLNSQDNERIETIIPYVYYIDTFNPFQIPCKYDWFIFPEGLECFGKFWLSEMND